MAHTLLRALGRLGCKISSAECPLVWRGSIVAKAHSAGSVRDLHALIPRNCLPCPLQHTYAPSCLWPPVTTSLRTLVTLTSLSPGSRKYRKRRGRGGGDKRCGRGHKGQKSRSGTGKPALFFEGSQTPLWKLLPKRGARNRFSCDYATVLLAELEAAVRLGRLDPSQPITMKHMYDAGLLGKKTYNKDGVVLLNTKPSKRKLARLAAQLGYPVPEKFGLPLNVEVSGISGPAREALIAAGGSVTRVYYNKLGMRALLLPEWFKKKNRLLPNTVQMVPFKKQWRFERVGTLPKPSSTLNM